MGRRPNRPYKPVEKLRIHPKGIGLIMTPGLSCEEKDFSGNEDGRQWCLPLRFTPKLD
jgi:hypothetical protein